MMPALNFTFEGLLLVADNVKMLLQTGMIPGIVLQIVCAVVSIYTLYLLLILYLHRKSEMVSCPS